MRRIYVTVVLVFVAATVSSRAQTPCPGYSVVANTPEDALMLAVNGADKPEEQVSALDHFAATHADSKFMPCANEYYVMSYIKLNQFDKAIEYGQKDLAANYIDLNLILNMLKAYVGAGKAEDGAFDLIAKAPAAIKTESTPARPAKATDEEWQKMQQDFAEQSKDQREFVEYAFFQLIPRVPDGAKRAQYLDAFMTAFPDTKNLGQVNYQYFLAYKMANNNVKADEYGEKTIAADPNNIGALNLVADDYAARQVNLDKASQYAKKALDVLPAAKKPEGMTDDQFKSSQNLQGGLAHLTLGYVIFQRAAKTRKVAGAIQEFNAAIPLLEGNPELQAKALYFLGNAYEFEVPPNHKGAAAALSRAASLQSSFQAQSRTLLAKIPKG
jgi:hypothetical protein